MDESSSTSQSLDVEVALLKREVEALQDSAALPPTPWYKNVSTIISVTALLFSFGTTGVSYVRTHAQDTQALRSDLRGLLQRLAALPKENFEITKKYADDPVTVSNLAGIINQENILLARQAAQVARRLPREQVSATEYNSIGAALQNGYDIAGAMTFYGLAERASTDLADEIGAQRSAAGLLFATGKPEAGRAEYRKALNVFARYHGYDEYTQKTTHVLTELNWAAAEAYGGSGEAARGHVENAEKYLVGLPQSPNTDLFRRQVEQVKARVSAGSGEGGRASIAR